MATSKTLTPTNVTIQIPAMTDAPDQSVNSNCIDKLGDAVNTLNSQIKYYEDKVVVPVGNYWTQRDSFKASRAGNVITFQGYFQIATEIPNGTKFASVGYTVNSGTVLIAEIGTGKAYPAFVNYSDGTLQSEGAIPTGYYRIGGCCTMQASAL